MSKMIEIDWRPDERTLRQFGWIAVVGFAFLAAIAWLEVFVFAFGLGAARPWLAGAFAALAGLAGLFSLVAPKANLPIYLGLTVLSYPIGFVLSYLIMGFLFFVLITPVGLFFKLTGRDPMHRRFDREATSYWSDPRPRRGKDSYFRQF
ncbi:MAG: SxtJ family membrane protein [bacterium]